MRDLLGVAAPLTLWLAGFGAIYGLQGLVCSDRWPEAVLAGRMALLLAAATALALQAGLLLALRTRALGPQSRFARRVGLTLAVTALIAALWTLAPVATTSVCL